MPSSTRRLLYVGFALAMTIRQLPSTCSARRLSPALARYRHGRGPVSKDRVEAQAAQRDGAQATSARHWGARSARTAVRAVVERQSTRLDERRPGGAREH